MDALKAVLWRGPAHLAKHRAQTNAITVSYLNGNTVAWGSSHVGYQAMSSYAAGALHVAAVLMHCGSVGLVCTASLASGSPARPPTAVYVYPGAGAGPTSCLQLPLAACPRSWLVHGPPSGASWWTGGPARGASYGTT